MGLATLSIPTAGMVRVVLCRLYLVLDRLAAITGTDRQSVNRYDRGSGSPQMFDKLRISDIIAIKF
jgi:predicted transcriptional regulator